MSHTIIEVTTAFEAGKAHWRRVVAGNDPILSEEFYSLDEFLQTIFAKGAVEIMDESPNAAPG